MKTNNEALRYGAPFVQVIRARELFDIARTFSGAVLGGQILMFQAVPWPSLMPTSLPDVAGDTGVSNKALLGAVHDEHESTSGG